MTPRVVVIGGGPAGLAAAIVLGRHDIPVLVVERATLPADKACGEGLLPNGVASLERLGVSRAALAEVGHPMVGVRYYSLQGRSVEGRFAGGTGFGVRRTHLSALLLEQARRWPSVEIATGVAANLDMRVDGAGVSVGDRRMSPALVIAADGLGSRTRTAAGIDVRVGPVRRWGMRQHVDVTPWSDMVEVHFGDGFEAYVTPLDAGLNVAILWDPSKVTVPTGDSGVLTMAARLPHLESRLTNARPLSRVRAAGPFAQRPAQRAVDGVLLMGDAAGYVDAMTGEGVGLALQHAECLERHVVPRLLALSAGRGLGAADLASFTRAVARGTRPNRLMTQLMLRIGRRPKRVEQTIALLGASPRLVAFALWVNMGAPMGFKKRRS